MEAVEPAAIANKALPLCLELIPNRPFMQFGMRMRLGVGDRAVEQPGVRFLIVLDPQAAAWRQRQMLCG